MLSYIIKLTDRQQTVLKILFLNTLSDNELLKEVHECKRQYKEAKIIIFDGQAEENGR